MYDSLRELLARTHGVQAGRFWHPERDVLYHQLQAFDLARSETGDRVLWAAALLHDVGKAVSLPNHAEVGADLLDGLIAPRVVWLVRHHFDLTARPRTRRRLRGTRALRELEQLRRWDYGGRKPNARVLELDQALEALLEGSDRASLEPTAGIPAYSEYGEAYR